MFSCDLDIDSILAFLAPVFSQKVIHFDFYLKEYESSKGLSIIWDFTATSVMNNEQMANV